MSNLTPEEWKANVDRLKVITGPDTRWAYACVWEPHPNINGKMRYSVRLLVPKTDTETVEKIRKGIESAYWLDLGRIQGRDEWPPKLEDIKTPLQDGDEVFPGKPEYAEHWFLNANSHTAPGVVDAEGKPITTRSEVYSGVYGRASISFFGFNAGHGSRGVLCALNNLMKVRDGEPLGHKATPEEDFKEVI